MISRDDQVLDMFRELPSHRGCPAAELDAVETALGVVLPLRYRELMELDAERLCGAGIFAPLRHLNELRLHASQLLIEDGHAFRLERADVVFGWDDNYAFYFFKADATDDPAVKMFNYYDSSHGWKPVMAFDTVTTYVAAALRRYLKLG